MTRPKKNFGSTALVQTILTVCCIFLSNAAAQSQASNGNELVNPRAEQAAQGECECVRFNLCVNGTIAQHGAGKIIFRIECDNDEVICCTPNKSTPSNPTTTTTGYTVPEDTDDEFFESTPEQYEESQYNPQRPYSNSRPSGEQAGSPTIDYHLPPGNRKFRCGERKYFANDSNYRAPVDQAEYGEFPWMVAIIKVNDKNGIINRRFICAGTLIHRQVVLTVAHCVKSLNITRIRLRAGDFDLDSPMEDHPYQELGVKQVIIHPQYSFSEAFTLEEDIALIVTKERFEYGPNVDIICLPKLSENINRERCTAAGWGLLPGLGHVKYKRSPERYDLPYSYSRQALYKQTNYDYRPFIISADDFYKIGNYELIIAVREHLKEVETTVSNLGASLDQYLGVKKAGGSNQQFSNNNNRPLKGETNSYSIHQHNSTSVTITVHNHSNGGTSGQNSASRPARPTESGFSAATPRPRPNPANVNVRVTQRPTTPSKPTPKILRKIELPIVRRRECEKKIRQFADGPGLSYNLPDSMFCAGGLQGKDTCKGDGGGPLMCPSKGNPSRMVQFGMVAAGFGCGNGVPAMYVNMTRMKTWIDNELEQLGFEPEYDY